MAANELKESLQALAWIKLQGVGAFLTADGIGFRSQCGFLDRVIASENVKGFPLLIFCLERYHSRAESALLLSGGLCTVNDLEVSGGSPNPTYRYNYNALQGLTPNANYLPWGPLYQPIDLAWLGSDLSDPDWLPFQTDDAVPGAPDLDLFNAIALLLPYDTDTEATWTGDVVLALHKMPKLTAQPSIEFVIPAPPVPPGP